MIYYVVVCRVSSLHLHQQHNYPWGRGVCPGSRLVRHPISGATPFLMRHPISGSPVFARNPISGATPFLVKHPILGAPFLVRHHISGAPILVRHPISGATPFLVRHPISGAPVLVRHPISGATPVLCIAKNNNIVRDGSSSLKLPPATKYSFDPRLVVG